MGGGFERIETLLSYVESVALAKVACLDVVASDVDLVVEECSIGVDVEKV